MVRAVRDCRSCASCAYSATKALPAQRRSRSSSPRVLAASPAVAQPAPSPSIVKAEPVDEAEVLSPIQHLSVDKGKAKEDVDAEGDVKMKDYSLSLVDNITDTEQSCRRRSRSPPTGPRHYLKTLTGPAAILSGPPTHPSLSFKYDWARRHAPTTPINDRDAFQIHSPQLPPIPQHKTRIAIHPDLVAEV